MKAPRIQNLMRVATVVVALALGGVAAQAQPGPGHHGGHDMMAASQHDAGVKLHEQMTTLFTTTNIDAAAIESVRAQMSALHDAASKRLSQASIDVARVLTPEQRAKIAEVMKKHQARMAAHQPG
jgi:Spy/CpxP family protein refolding chaperone